MRIFVSFHYGPRDQWVREQVIPIIQALGCEAMTGEQTYGGEILQVVKDRIGRCDAIIGFLTRRDPSDDGRFATHRAVMQELDFADAGDLLSVEVRETGVEVDTGMRQGRQWIGYDESRRDVCLVDICKALGGWRRRFIAAVKLRPQSVVQAMYPHVRRRGLDARIIMTDDRGQPLGDRRVSVVQDGQGLYIRPGMLPEGTEFIEIRASAHGQSWYSEAETVRSRNVELLEGD